MLTVNWNDGISSDHHQQQRRRRVRYHPHKSSNTMTWVIVLVVPRRVVPMLLRFMAWQRLPRHLIKLSTQSAGLTRTWWRYMERIELERWQHLSGNSLVWSTPLWKALGAWAVRRTCCLCLTNPKRAAQEYLVAFASGHCNGYVSLLVQLCYLWTTHIFIDYVYLYVPIIFNHCKNVWSDVAQLRKSLVRTEVKSHPPEEVADGSSELDRMAWTFDDKVSSPNGFTWELSEKSTCSTKMQKASWRLERLF